MIRKNSLNKASLFIRLFSKNDQRKRAYTLIEMSVVFLVLSVLITGGITIANSMMNDSKKQVTNQRLKVVYDAFGRFIAKHKRLPCPASLTLAKSELGYGQESSGDCILKADEGIYSSNDVQNIVYGMVPVHSLGLSDEYAEDGFGSKFSYVVNSHLTTKDDVDSYDSEKILVSDSDYRQGFGLYRSSGDETLNITQISSGNSISDVAFAIISHGVNKNGAFSSDSSTQNSVIVNGDEYHNISRNPSGGIGGAISRSSFGKMIDGKLHLIASNIQGDSFDDIMIFKSRSQIVGDFELASLIPCIPGDEMQNQGFKIVYSGETSTGNSCTGHASIQPQKTCGPQGSWLNKSNCPEGSVIAQDAPPSDMAIDTVAVATDPYMVDGALLPFIP